MRTFPQYHDAQDSINSILSTEGEIKSYYDSAFSTCFKNFFKSQPDEIKNPYAKIQKAEAAYIIALNSCQMNSGVIGSNFHRFLEYYNTLLSHDLAAKESENLTSKLEQDMNRKKQLYEQDNQHGQVESAANSEMLYKKAQSKYEEQKQHNDDLHQNLQVEKKEYAKQFSSYFIDQFLQLVEIRKGLIQKKIQTAESIKSSVSEFSNIHDPVISQLEERLSNWEKEEI